MLLELDIKNFAIIEDLNIQFTKGLNLLTGETGSGKSIIIEALGIILGGRGTKDLIRSGEDKSTLQAVFFLENLDKVKNKILEYGIEQDSDNLLIISREIASKGPSISRVNGKTVTLSILNKITDLLVDIFAQEEHQSLLNVSNHKDLIDSFGNKEFMTLKEEIRRNYLNYVKEKEELEKINIDINQRNREIDLIKFQIQEIDDADLSDKEDDLENEYSKLLNIKDINLGISKINDLYNNYNYGDTNIQAYLNNCISILLDLIKFDKSLQSYLDRMESVNYELEDINNDLINYKSTNDLDEERLYKLRERIDLINKLKRKYGNTIDDILSYREKINKELQALLNFENEISIRKNNIEKISQVLLTKSKKISEIRKIIGADLEKQILKELDTLNMENVNFKVNFKERTHFSIDGIDQIEFLISTNIGEDLKSLNRIVSGGEMSRIMLGFKSILAEADNIPTLIFDEIDTGISGRTAQIVGEKIHRIAKKHQVISVSHLPQITALADSHYQISKKINNQGKVTTQITKLNDEERIYVLARLLGGVNVTSTTLKHAKEMLEMSKNI